MLKKIKSNFFPLIFLATLSGFTAIFLGQDTNWDLLNYHFYNPYALLNNRMNSFDYAPAQLQTFLNPLFDFPSYAILIFIKNPLLVTFLLGCISGIPIFLVYKISLQVLNLDSTKKFNLIYSLIATIIGATGAAYLSTLGTVFTETISCILVLFSLLLMLAHINDKANSFSVIASGLAIGIAVGGKLTNIPFAIGLTFCIIFSPLDSRGKFRALFLFLSFAFLGLCASISYWSYLLYENFKNPIFPFFNQYFQSEWASYSSFSDLRFLPKTIFEWIFYPIYWAFSSSSISAEVSFRDPRIAFVFIIILISIPIFIFNDKHNKPSNKPKINLLPIISFFIVSYIFWIAKFGIYRYLLPLELISGIIAIALVVSITKNIKVRNLCVALLAICTLLLTSPINWGRVPHQDTFFNQKGIPKIPNDSLLVFVGDDPMSYILPLMHGSIKSVGIENNLVHSKDNNLLVKKIKGLIKDTGENIFSVSTLSKESEVDKMLKNYELYRIQNKCMVYQSNVGSALNFCPLSKSFQPSTYAQAQSIELLKDLRLTPGGIWGSFTATPLNQKINYVTVNEPHPLTQLVAIEPNKIYLNSLSLRCHKDKAQGRVQVNWLNAENKFISSSGSVHDCTENWSRYSDQVIAPSNAKFAQIYISGHTNKFIDASNPSFKK
jgi:hypothetical protein